MVQNTLVHVGVYNLRLGSEQLSIKFSFNFVVGFEMRPIVVWNNVLVSLPTDVTSRACS